MLSLLVITPRVANVVMVNVWGLVLLQMLDSLDCEIKSLVGFL